MSAEVRDNWSPEVVYWCADGNARRVTARGQAAREWATGERVCKACRDQSYWDYLRPFADASDQAAVRQRALVDRALEVLGESEAVTVRICTAGGIISRPHDPRNFYTIGNQIGYCWEIRRFKVGIDVDLQDVYATLMLRDNGSLFVLEGSPTVLVDSATNLVHHVVRIHEIRDDDEVSGALRALPFGLPHDGNQDRYLYRELLAVPFIEGGLEELIVSGGQTSTPAPEDFDDWNPWR